MASTNKTTNYELSQFEGTDKPSWEADYNADMLSIDTNLKAVSDVADGASGSISTLADRVTAAEGNISTNANDIDALEARADALEAGAQSTAGTIADIQTEQTAQNLGIEAATQLGYNIARPYDSASTYAAGDLVLFNNTLYKCNVLNISTGEPFNEEKWISVKATDLCLVLTNVLAYGNDCNNLPINSIAYIYTNTANVPANIPSSCICVTLKSLVSAKYQCIITDDKIFIRSQAHNSSTFSSWYVYSGTIVN